MAKWSMISMSALTILIKEIQYMYTYLPEKLRSEKLHTLYTVYRLYSVYSIYCILNLVCTV
mgnify:CR=1 FL=1